MANRILKVHYIEDFNFKIQLELDKKLFYQLTCKTVGINEYVATWHWENDVWVCENCAIVGDEITIFATDHKLPAGKVVCHVEMRDEEGMSKCIQVDPNIFLSFIPVSGPTDIDDLDEAQTLDIIRLDDEIKALKEKYSDYDGALSEIENNYSKAAKAHHERLDRIDEMLEDNKTDIDEIKSNITGLEELQTSLNSRLTTEVEKLNDRITNLVINSGSGDVDLTDVYNQINENKTTIQLLKNYIDNLDIPEAVDLTPITEKLTLLEVGLLALEGIDHSKFLTEHQDISHLATKEELKNYQPVGDYATTQQLNNYQPKGDYATASSVQSIHDRLDYFDTINHDEFATKEELSDAISNIPTTDLTQYYTKSELDNKFDEIEHPQYDDTDIKNRLTSLEGIDHSKFATTDSLNNYQPKGNYLTEHQDISNLATKSELQTAINNIPETDLSDYYNKTEVDTKIADAVTNGEVDLTNYYTKSEVDTQLGNIEHPQYDDTEVKNRLTTLEGIDHSKFATTDSLNNYQPKGDYLTEHQDISNLVTKTELQTAIDGIPQTDLSNLLTKDDASTYYITKDDANTYYYSKDEVDTKIAAVATGGEVDLSNYYTKIEVETKIDEIEHPQYDDTDIKNRLLSLEGIDHSQYLTQHQDISNLATKTELEQAIEGLGTGNANAEFISSDTNCPDEDNVVYFIYNEVDYVHTEYAIADK